MLAPLATFVGTQENGILGNCIPEHAEKMTADFRVFRVFVATTELLTSGPRRPP